MTADRQLRKGQSPLHAVLEAAPDAMLAIDKAGHIVLVNAWAAKLFGCQERDLLGRKVAELFARRVQDACRRHIRGCFARTPKRPQKSVPQSFPLFGLRKDGTEFPVELSMGATDTARGMLLVCGLRDVSGRARMQQEFREAHARLDKRSKVRALERSRTNRELQREIAARRRSDESLRFLRDIVRSSDVAIIGRKLDGTVVSWNPAARRMFGYPAKEMIGRSILTIVPPERLPESRKIMAAIRRGERLEQIDVVGMRKDGRRVPMIVTVSPVRNAGGKLIGASVIARDISQRIRDEARIRYERDRAEHYLQIVQVILLVLDLHGRVVLLNRKGCQVLGYRLSDLVHRDWHGVCIPRAVRRQSREAFRQLLSQEPARSQHSEIPVLTKSGEERLIAWHSNILRDEYGRIIGTLSSGEDITEQRAAGEAQRQFPGRLLQARDEERRRIARELHDSTAQRLALLITQLGRGQRLASQGKANADNLLREARTMARQALREVRSLAYLLHPPLLEEMGLPAALRIYLDGVRKQDGMRIDFEMPARMNRSSRSVELSAFRIVQEALGNALRHSHSSRVHIKLKREGRSLVVKVIDDGLGLAPGANGQSGSARRYTGMGLASMRERASLVGGRLDIRSGKSGTIVTAVIPVAGRAGEKDTHTRR